jgi:hypothetical protein
MAQGREQVSAGRPLFVAPPQRFAVEAQALTHAGGGRGRGQDRLSSLSECGFQALAVQAPEDQVKRRGTGHACPREAQRLLKPR